MPRWQVIGIVLWESCLRWWALAQCGTEMLLIRIVTQTGLIIYEPVVNKGQSSVFLSFFLGQLTS